MTENSFLPADILLPNGVDFTKWSVVACDQFSSEPGYWERVKKTVGDSASTLKLIVPEAYLEQIDPVQSAASIGETMQKYQQEGILREYANSFVFLERTMSNGQVRCGLVGKLDLEMYDYAPGTSASVRASEKTIVSRLPARVEVRRMAPLELPHIMALIDDKECHVIEPLTKKTAGFEQVYSFDLMEGGGAMRGWRVAGADAAEVNAALSDLFASSSVQIIIGDGNHSLAAAKSYWDEIKMQLDETTRQNHPARFALVELNNVYDPAVRFEAIHRLVFNTNPTLVFEELTSSLTSGEGKEFELNWMSATGRGVIKTRATGVGQLIERVQACLDNYVARTGCGIDYIHGEESLEALAEEPGSMGLQLPIMDKSEFFETVIAGGLFPKKSFSIGHAYEKRYYLECRAIR